MAGANPGSAHDKVSMWKSTVWQMNIYLHMVGVVRMASIHTERLSSSHTYGVALFTLNCQMGLPSDLGLKGQHVHMHAALRRGVLCVCVDVGEMGVSRTLGSGWEAPLERGCIRVASKTASLSQPARASLHVRWPGS